MLMFLALNGYTSISFVGRMSIEKIRHVRIVSIIGSFRDKCVKHNLFCALVDINVAKPCFSIYWFFLNPTFLASVQISVWTTIFNYLPDRWFNNKLSFHTHPLNLRLISWMIVYELLVLDILLKTIKCHPSWEVLR